MQTLAENLMQRLSCLAAAVLLSAGALHAQAAPAAPGALPTAQPEAVGVDSTRLVALSEWIRRDRLDVRSLVVVKDGKVVFERYSEGVGRDYNHELYSVTKFISALLVGTLVGDGKLAVSDAPAPRLAAARPNLAPADRKSVV